MFRDMGVISVPTAYIIEPEGKVSVVLKGEVKWQDESIRKLILSHIPGNPETPKNSYKEPGVNFQLTKKQIDNSPKSSNNDNITTENQQDKTNVKDKNTP